ncbi:hypothetical protein HPB52_008809 [Rhipicephalus sanguineus]|uniref:Uncharacterized protein n=1 Tax=Rhipicephalus sanguineus TaxID=34632 RepID=A0A9D4T814_RHISA|nr:hypothetical protein HPB52_008809 [Rhipicephalus sanguineus]
MDISNTARAGRRASALAAPHDLRDMAPPPTPDTLEKHEGERAQTVAQVAIAAIANDRERFVGRVHFHCDDKRIDDAFRELSSLFPTAVPPEVSADDFVEADCNVQAVASLADEDIVAAVAGTQDAQADSSSGNEDRPDEAAATRAYSAAEVAAAFGLIHRCCGDMEGTGLSHLDSLDFEDKEAGQDKRFFFTQMKHSVASCVRN